MSESIYIRLLNEGTVVYKKAFAKKISKNIFYIENENIYDPLDEEWEFPPCAYVLVEEQLIGGDPALVAIALQKYLEP